MLPGSSFAGQGEKNRDILFLLHTFFVLRFFQSLRFHLTVETLLLFVFSSPVLSEKLGVYFLQLYFS